MKIIIKRGQFTSFEKLFLIVWTVYSVNYALFTASEIPYDYAIGHISTYISYATIVFLVILLFLKRYPYNKLLTYIVILVLVFLVEFSVSDRNFLIYILFIILAQDVKYEKILRFDFILKIVLISIIIGLCILGVTDNYTSYSVTAGTYKQSIGFSNYNTFTCYALTILCEWLCLRYKKMKWYEWLLILAFWFLTLAIGVGRSSAYTFLFIFILFFVATKIPNIFYSRISKLIFIIITPLMCVLSFVLIYLYNRGNALAKFFDVLITNRFSYASRIINTYGIKLFGQEIELVSTRRAKLNHVSSVILDNAYAKCAVCWGIIILICLIIMYCVLFRKFLNYKRIDLALLALFFVILGLGESYMLNVLYNTTLLCLLGVQNISCNYNYITEKT